MSNYVLVHGGDRDGSIWNEVAQSLRHQGQTVFCPSMTPITQTTLEYNIDEICEVIKNNHLNDVILTGHSYGAMVITGVMEKLHDKISYLIYIDSVIPINSKSLYGILAENGFNYEDFGLTPDQPCIEPLFFNEDLFNKIPKVYVRCTQSEFKAITQIPYKNMIENAQKNNWIYFDLDTKHACMLTQPRELSVILYGVQIFSS